jgi:transposase
VTDSGEGRRDRIPTYSVWLESLLSGRRNVIRLETLLIERLRSLDGSRCYSKTLYKQRYTIAIILGRIKDWRRPAARYDHCAHTPHLSVICLAATVIFYLKE